MDEHGGDSLSAGNRAGSEDTAGSEHRFLVKLMDYVADRHAEVHQAMLRRNPDLVESYGKADGLRGRIRRALVGPAVQRTAEQERLLEQTRELWARRLQEREKSSGILTSLTRQLPPEKGLELYRKIAPVLVYEILNRLNQSAALHVVSQLVDHLCSDDVQNKLRQAEHVRQAILDELCTVLRQSEIHEQISSRDLENLLHESGGMGELIAMENCIKLAGSKAG